MRQIKIGGQDFNLVASPMTLYFYKKEFKKDLLSDLMAFDGLENDATKFDGILILQMAWAMIKTSKTGQLVTFEQWLNGLEFVDFEDTDMSMAIQNKANKNIDNDDAEIGILVTAKRMGLGFDELNLFSLDDYLAFVEKFVGKEENGTRQASQEDINRFMG